MQMEKPKCHPGWDFAGIIASGLCAVHCLLLPVLLPVLAVSAGTPYVELPVVGVAIVTGIAALSQGRRHHRQTAPFVVWSMGMTALIAFHLPSFFEVGGHTSHSKVSSLEFAGMSFGGLLIVGAHTWNLILHRRSHHQTHLEPNATSANTGK